MRKSTKRPVAQPKGTRKRKETTQAWVDRVYGTKARAPEANRIDRFIDAIGVLVRAHINIERANRDKAVSWLFFSLELESAEERMRALLTEASK